MVKQALFGKRFAALLTAAFLASSLALAGCASPAQTASSASSSSSSASPAAQAAAMQVSVSVVADDTTDAITVANADFQPIQNKPVDLSEGASAFDALKASGVDVVSEDGAYGVYVTSINGVSNGSEGPSSGWTYTVNGESPAESAGTCILSDGDEVVWTFVTSFE